MPAVIKVGLGDLAEKLGADLAKLETVAVKAIQTSLATKGIAYAVDETSRARPRAPVDRGAYRQSFRVAELPNGGVLYNMQPYAGVIEYGRRKGKKQPPIDVLTRWVLRKGLVDRPGVTKANHDQWKRARQIAFAIARKMKREGWPFQPNQPMNIIHKAVERLLPDLPADIVAAWKAAS